MPRQRTGTIARNARGEPVGVKCYTAADDRVTVWYSPSHAPVSEEEAQRRTPELVALAAGA